MLAVHLALVSQKAAGVGEARKFLTALGGALVGSVVLVHVFAVVEVSALRTRLYVLVEGNSLPLAFATKFLAVLGAVWICTDKFTVLISGHLSLGFRNRFDALGRRGGRRIFFRQRRSSIDRHRGGSRDRRSSSGGGGRRSCGWGRSGCDGQFEAGLRLVDELRGRGRVRESRDGCQLVDNGLGSRVGEAIGIVGRIVRVVLIVDVRIGPVVDKVSRLVDDTHVCREPWRSGVGGRQGTQECDPIICDAMRCDVTRRELGAAL
mgnify:CR=1 FL=1